jgi:hypothetical protein
VDRAAADIARGERWLRDALPDLERSGTLGAFVFVSWHDVTDTWEP